MQFSSLITIFIFFVISEVSCKGRCYQGLCAKGKPYSKENDRLVKRLVNKHISNIKFNVSVLVEPDNSDNSEVLTKSPLYNKYENLCDTRKITHIPEYYKNDTSIKIVQVPKYRQKFTFEVCAKNSGPCHHKESFDTETSCRQLYQKVRLLIVKNNTTLEFKMFKMPSTCVCTMRKTYLYGGKNYV